MLTEKTKNFIEKIAVDMQNQVTMMKQNQYNLKNIVDFVKSMGCNVLFDQDTNSFRENTIFLSFAQKNVEQELTEQELTEQELTEQKYKENEFLKILFHEIWHFISSSISDSKYPSQYSEISINPKEAEANYFTRAMLLPEESFVKEVINNIADNGMCNIFEVANSFNVNYMDVIARGNDLSIWNKKGGM